MQLSEEFLQQKKIYMVLKNFFEDDINDPYFVFRMELPSTKEFSEVKLDKRTLQKGLLLEFRKDSQKSLLAVAQKPDGKRNWMVYDQVLIETTLAC